MLWALVLALVSIGSGVKAASPFESLLKKNVPSRGGAATATDPKSLATDRIIRVAYQGEPGAYSEKSTRELLGKKVTAVGHPSFEHCFRAVASMECDYACLPIENSLGGSIHENYDLMLRYDLTIVGEHEFRVQHCLLAKPGVKREDIKYAISHPQALAQCDNFLRGLGITPIPTYDTAGSAKMISENSGLPDKCTPENTAAIASDLAGRTYNMNCLDTGIEDDDTNFTRFLLLARKDKDVAQYLNSNIPAKTSVVFTLKNKPGALYKALACFSLRDIDFSKIESRPTSASLLNFLKFKSQQTGMKSRNKANIVRFRYCFYLDFLANQLDENTQNALAHLREQADFVRILGSYPQKSRLVGPVAQEVENLKNMAVNPDEVSLLSSPSGDTKTLKIGIVGFDAFGQFLAKRLTKTHRVSCMDPQDKVRVTVPEKSGVCLCCILVLTHCVSVSSLQSIDAQKLGVEFFRNYESTKFLQDVDVVVLATPLVQFEDVINSLPLDALRGKLVVETCVLNSHPKAIMLRAFGKIPDIDILSTHPMVGQMSAAGEDPYTESSWEGRPMVYEKVRIVDFARCEAFLQVFEQARCQMVEMSAEQHDESIADAEFVTHLTGRLLVDKQLLPPTPVISKEYAALADVADMTSGDSFDLFFGMFKFNDRARDHLTKMRDNLSSLERQLAAKEAYLQASMEMKNNDRERLLAETKLLLQEVVSKNGGLFEDTASVEKESKPAKGGTGKKQ